MNVDVSAVQPMARSLSKRTSGVATLTRRLSTWVGGAMLALTALFTTVPASAAVEVRVEARPVSDPIETYVTVTDSNGQPVSGLTVDDFVVTVDGEPVTVDPADFSLPPSLNPDRNVSVVFAMDYTPSTEGTARTAMEDAVVEFINSMQIGDYAAIVKFNGTNPNQASVVQPFTEIDGGAGTSALVSAATSPYDGRESNVFDGVDVSLDHFANPGVTLPDGPKAVILISDGIDDPGSNATLDEVIAKAGDLGIPIFTIAIGTPGTEGEQVLTSLSSSTGGTYLPAPTDEAIASAYDDIQSLLNNGYLLSFESTIDDCDEHTVEITVAGQDTPASTTFVRRDDCAPPSSGSGGGGGGGSFGLAGVLLGLAAFAARRRRSN